MRTWLLAVVAAELLGGAAQAADGPADQPAASGDTLSWKPGMVCCRLQGWFMASQLRPRMRCELVDEQLGVRFDYAFENRVGTGYVLGSRRYGFKLEFRTDDCGDDRLSGVSFFGLFQDWPDP